MIIRKAVIPAAGFGTRFLPATKVQPKEMLPIVDKPTIQYVVEEAVASGITDILIITGRGKQAIENHFDRSAELEFMLKERGKTEALNKIKDIADMANIHYIRQKEQRGLGDAIMYAEKFISGEPFVVLLGDDIITSKTPCTRQMIDVFNKYQGNVIALEEVEKEKIPSKGIIKGREIEPGVLLLDDLIEKPKLEDAPSNLGIAGRYILLPEIFDMLRKTDKGAGGEIQLTDAIRLLNKEKKSFGLVFEGKRHDIGNPLDYIKATIEFAINRKDMNENLMAFLKKIVGDKQ